VNTDAVDRNRYGLATNDCLTTRRNERGGRGAFDARRWENERRCGNGENQPEEREHDDKLEQRHATACRSRGPRNRIMAQALPLSAEPIAVENA
jgi:hypothetical protein